ncbi:MAG: hypothetical protein ACI3Z0_03285 [Candidatus Cryptobacteroides sp.]
MNKIIAAWAKVKDFFSSVFNYIRIDGFLHLMAAALILLSLRPIIGYLWAITITVLVCVAKELHDKFSGKGAAEWHDIICDVIGIIYASIVILISLL